MDTDELSRLYMVATAAEAEALDDLRLRAGILRLCECGWRNHETEATCGGCGKVVE